LLHGVWDSTLKGDIVPRRRAEGNSAR
jgi:hypothetical protein